MCRCTSPNISRMRQNALPCCEAVGDGGVEHEALARGPSARISSSTSRRPLRACDDNSISTYQGCGARPADRGLLASCLTTTSMPVRTISSNEVTPPAVRSLAMPSRSTAACGEGTPTKAVSTERGRGTRRKHRRGDDAERAFGADEQVLQVVAGIVLLQLVEIVQHAAVGQHHFEAERMRARDAVGDRRGAAGIGREIAADGAGAFRRQQLRIEPVGRGRRFARALQRDAGLARHGVGDRIDLADLVEPRERQHDLAVEAEFARRPGRYCRPAARSRSWFRWRA